jgi:hypothetical protein
MGLGEDVKKNLLALSGKALERLLADEKRATQIAKAVGAVQRGKKALDNTQDEVLNTLGFASKSDYKELGKRLSALKRKVKEVAARVEKLP